MTKDRDGRDVAISQSIWKSPEGGTGKEDSPLAASGGRVATTTVSFGSSPINFGTPDSLPSTSCFSLHLPPNSKARMVFLKHRSHPLSPPPCQSHHCPHTKIQMCLPGLQVSAWPGLTYPVPQQEFSPDHKGFSRVSGSLILCPSSCCPLARTPSVLSLCAWLPAQGLSPSRGSISNQ